MNTQTVSRFVLFIGALCLSLGAASGARATLIPYTFSPDASQSIPFNPVVSISGSFEFDTTASAVTVFDITIAVPGSSEVLDEAASGICSNSATVICAGSSVNSDVVIIPLAQSLALDAPDPLILAGAGTLAGCSCFNLGAAGDASAVAGSAIPAPEPPTVAILVATLGLFGLIRWLSSQVC